MAKSAKGKKSQHANRQIASRAAVDQRGNARPRMLSWVLLIVVLMGAGVVLATNHARISGYLNRSVESVRIKAQLDRVSESEVTRILAAYMHVGFLDIDVTGVKGSLESHPWIARAAVKRIWPDSLELTISEEIAIARWGESSLLNQYGEVFTPPTLGESRVLPKLTGSDEMRTLMMSQFQVLSQLFSQKGMRIAELNLSARGSWEITIEGGMRIIAGKDDVRGKVRRLVDIYDPQSANDIADIESIDLRYRNGFAVKRRALDETEFAVR